MMTTTSPQEAVQIVKDWLEIYPAPFTDLFVIVPDQKSKLELSTPLFWYAFYTLREEKKLNFEEPLLYLLVCLDENSGETSEPQTALAFQN